MNDRDPESPDKPTQEVVEQKWIAAGDIANYAVCPEAWRLKFVGAGTRLDNPRMAESQGIRKDWVAKQELSKTLSRYAKVAYSLLVLLTILVFLFESFRPEFLNQILNRRHADGSSSGSQGGNPLGSTSPFDVPPELLSLLLVLGLIIYMWDLFERRSANARENSGLIKGAETLAVKGGTTLPTRELVSERLQLSGRPDAIIREGQQIIPVDMHPLTNKVRDRHVLQLLTHLRLIEELEGVEPDHGVLLMGKEQRRVAIKNAPDKQRWLESLIDEMRSIMDGVPAIPSPSTFKCKSCDVRLICQHSAYDPKHEPKGKHDDDKDNC